ncbi:MAG TPA: hypothetical protein PKK72_10890 [Chitinophagales bacterium]|nr:hypothetical protein [Chitinophagales bacterium]HNE46951.1 hypothetical protein [Chitinophagales bacterium]HNK98261.1 hypothetical protein [Chitinophagales bacterium]HNM09079.1 hypothetical protein [Chitinophagales bacterium]HNO29248.1 hypothetical protein [Chitinophagales bacterium]
MSKRKYVKYGIGFLFIAAAMVTLMGYATMYLWNWLIPEIFGGTTVTFWQAIGLIALGKLLTGFMSWGPKSWGKHHMGYKGQHWRAKMEAKLANMTPEEREKFKKYYYDRCGWKTPQDLTENPTNQTA